VHTAVSDFASGSHDIPASALSVTPSVVTEQSTAAGVWLAPRFSASTGGSAFAMALPGDGIGTTTFSADLRLTAPLDAPAATYRAKMTVTVVSR
jgi:hypothetical protein